MKKIIVGALLFALDASAALAQRGDTGSRGDAGYRGDTGDRQISLLDPFGDTSFYCLVQYVIAALFTLSIPLCSIMVLIGGYQILTAAGDEEKLKTGRKTITYAAIGFAVILLASGVVSLIGSIFKLSISVTGAACPGF